MLNFPAYVNWGITVFLHALMLQPSTYQQFQSDYLYTEISGAITGDDELYTLYFKFSTNAIPSTKNYRFYTVMVIKKCTIQ